MSQNLDWFTEVYDKHSNHRNEQITQHRKSLERNLKTIMHEYEVKANENAWQFI